MKRLKVICFIEVVLLCLLFASCNTTASSQHKSDIQVSTKNDGAKKYEVEKKIIEEEAHKYGCMTVEEFVKTLKDAHFSYLIEKELPVLVYVNEMRIEDIVSEIPVQKFSFTPEISLDVILSSYIDVNTRTETFEGELEDSDEIFFVGETFVWAGEPSSRKNECWIKGRFGNSLIDRVVGFVGVAESQTDWVISKASQDAPATWRSTSNINEPVIIRINRIRKSQDIDVFVDADLIEIISE